ncbi:hypothetical protein P3T23_007752 [Paraburkholderia sp. GAS448]
MRKASATAPESGHDCNVVITSIAARIGYAG